MNSPAMQLSARLGNLIAVLRAAHTPLREKLFSSLAAFAAILLLVNEIHYVSNTMTFSLLVLASMGASAFLLFVVPHSPMAQPWPLVGGHVLAAAVGIACAAWIDNAALATALAVALSIFFMHWLHCLHPPSAATAMIAVLGGPEVHALGWQFCYEIVAINAGTMLVLAVLLNALIPGRRYPMFHSHHPHHEKYASEQHAPTAQLSEQDFNWALGRMDGIVDVSPEDLIDLYEFAVEHAQARKGGRAYRRD